MERTETIAGGIDLGEMAKRYESEGFLRRFGKMLRGLRCPRGTREYKIARIELQRLAAPLVAVVVPALFAAVLVVVTMMSSQPRNEIPLDLPGPLDKDPVIEDPPDPPPPPDPEPTEPQVQVTVDMPDFPTQVEPLPPAPLPPSAQQAAITPVTQDAVMNVKSPVTMKTLFKGRDYGSIRKAISGGVGQGDTTTEVTVLKVLWWLKARQNSDGSWGKGGYAVANTALAVLTYLAHGEHPGSQSPYRRDFGPVVQSAVDYLISRIVTDKDGTPHFSPTDGHEYSFLIATYALCEAYGMTGNPNCKEAATKCLARIVANQSPTGGWDYNLNRNSSRDDLSFAGWAIQALKAGKMAGLHPDGMQRAIGKAVNCLKRRNLSRSGGFTYTPRPGNDGGATGLAGVGTLALQFLGRGGEAEAVNALNVMRDWKPSFDPDGISAKKPGGSPQYYCYYATQCKYQAGMKPGAAKGDEVAWERWNAAMKKLYPSQIKDLPDKVKDCAGNGHRQGYFENRDAHSTRPYMDTCLVALQLMVYYRYLPTTSVKAGAEDASGADGGAKSPDMARDVAVVVNI